VSRRGFTLIEVLVALVVTVAALTIVCQGFATGARASSSAQKVTRAALLAQRVLTDFETGELTPGQSHAGGFEDEPDFAYETRSEVDVTGLTLLRVSVTWDERGQPRTYVLTRLFRERTAAP
jgi:prepilin-type N-terminal cleavage/methylation domain-containing protein